MKCGILKNVGLGRIARIENWLKEMGIKNYTINPNDLTINVSESIDLTFKNLEGLPEYIKFNEVRGSFNCSFNNFKSFKGCPKIVTGNFLCSYNKLESLEGCPKYVGGIFRLANPNTSNDNIKYTHSQISEICNVRYEIMTEENEWTY